MFVGDRELKPVALSRVKSQPHNPSSFNPASIFLASDAYCELCEEADSTCSICPSSSSHLEAPASA
jgi:hypothetical protein